MKKHDLCHVEIRTRDLQRAKGFYEAAFEWKLSELMEGYAGIDTGTSPGGGMMQIPGGADAPTGVCNYFLVESCEASARRASELGAKIAVPKTEVPQMGWFVNVIDPAGNELGLWQPANPDASAPAPQGSGRNGFCWVEFSAPDIDASVSFFSELFGWKFQVEEASSYGWTEHGGGSVGIGLLGGEMAGMHKGALTYVDVDDLAAAAKRIESAGGRMLHGPQEIPGTGAFSVFADLDGNSLAIFKGSRQPG